MSRIDDIFARCRAEGRTALMPFVTSGYPSLEVTARVLPALEQAGASIVELGFPFSDPIADGPVIAASMHEALLSGTTPARIFDLVRSARDQTSLGLVAMVSDSIIARMAPRIFIEQCAASGIDGLIVPDIDHCDAADLRDRAQDRGMSFTVLIAPTSTPDRMRTAIEICTGFIYLLARVGITGESDHSPEIADRVALVRSMTDLPIAVGFGISTPGQVRAVTEHADAAIVGSALVRRMGEATDPAAAAGEFIAQLAGGLVARAPHESKS